MPRTTCLRSAVDLLSATRVSVREAARVLAREPDSVVTRTLKLWGDDEDPFRHLIASDSESARIWRESMAALLQHLRPDQSRRTVWRGWYFSSARKRRNLLSELERTGRFENTRVGMSASRSRRVACRPEFLNEHGALWEIRTPRSARDLAPIFQAIGAKYPEQREVVFPRGASFELVGAPGWKILRRDGQRLRIRHYVLKEKP